MGSSANALMPSGNYTHDDLMILRECYEHCRSMLAGQSGQQVSHAAAFCRLYPSGRRNCAPPRHDTTFLQSIANDHASDTAQETDEWVQATSFVDTTYSQGAQSFEHSKEAELCATSTNNTLIETPVGDPAAVPLTGSVAWLWALTILLAVRFTRTQLDAESYYERRRKLILEGPISASKELLQKRRQYETQEASRQQSMSAERVAAAAARALEEERKRAQERKRYVEEAEREAQKLKEELEAQQKEYEAREAALRREYEARVEQERQLREAAAAAARAKEEEQRRVEQERKAALAAEQARREAEERAAREAERQRRLEEKQRLLKEKQRFVSTIDATCLASKPPPGTMVEGRLLKPAVIAVTCTASSVLTSEQSTVEAVYARISDAQEDAPRVAGQCAQAQCTAYATSMRLQAMMEQGPLAFLDELEFRHWMNVSAVRCACAMLESLRRQLGTVSRAQGTATPAPFKIRTEWAALAVDHPSSLPSQFSNAITLFEQEQGQQAVQDVLEEMFEDTRKELQQGLPPGTTTLPYMAEALVWAQLLDRMLDSRPAKQAGAPAWWDQAGNMAAEYVKELTRDAPKDSLEPISLLLSTVLGVEHPVSRMFQERAVKNMSKEVREARQQRAMLAEAEVAAKLLEEEWPDYRQLAEARIQEQEANTPIPERVWALRNVAKTLALGGAGEKQRARALLEQAVGLKQVYCGGPEHPGALPELLALYSVLSSVAAWEEDARAAGKDVLKLFVVVAERYAAQGNALAGTVLLEAAVGQFEGEIGFRDSLVSTASRRAEQLYETLDDEERAVAASKRGPSGVLEAVAAAFTEDLEVYATPGSSSRVQQWEEVGTAMLPSIV